MLTQLDLHPEHCRAVEALDDSMAPLLRAHSVTLSDFRRRDPRDGGIFVIGPEASPSLRRLVRKGTSWWVEADNPAWPARELDSPGEILGEGLWRSMALPPSPMRPPSPDPGPAVNVTQMETEGLKPWPVPHREPDSALDFEPDRVAWFEVGFLRALGVEPLLTEAVTVRDSSMAPTLWPMSSVLIDRRRTECRHGAIYELANDAGCILRRLIGGGDQWQVAQDGRPEAPTRPLRQTDMILGEAVWTGAFLPGGPAGPESGP